MILALIGAKRSGKDTVGSILVNSYGFVRVSIADNIRDAAYALDPLVLFDPWLARNPGISLVPPSPPENLHTRRLSDVVDEYGWFEAQRHPDIRLVLQRMGKEMVEPKLGIDTWLNLALVEAGQLAIADRSVVITDFRYCHEVDNFHHLFRTEDFTSVVWMVQRKGFDQIKLGAHRSEQEWMIANYDDIISNDGTLEDLEQSVRSMYEAFTSPAYG